MRLDDLIGGYKLLPGVFRGIPLSIIDVSSDHGRRVLEYLFPGVDAASYDDFGVAPSGISIEALYVGEDYKLRAKLLAKAFETAGPGLLIHPWLGPIQVIMEEPAQIRFSERELRVIRISARFKRTMPVSLASLPSGVSSAVSGLTIAASGLALTIADTVLSAARTAATIRSRRVTASVVNNAAARSGSRSAVSQIKSALAASSPASPASFDPWIIAAASIVSTVTEVPAVASARPAAAQPSAISLVDVGMSIAAGLVAQASSAPSDADALLLSIASAHFIAQSCAQSAYADFVSRREAMACRSSITSTLAALSDRVEASAPDRMQSSTSALVRATRTLSAAIASDLTETIGRLPAVKTIAAPRDVDAWAVAQHLAGDNPARIESVYADIVARNDPAHPARLASGTIEFLERN